MSYDNETTEDKVKKIVEEGKEFFKITEGLRKNKERKEERKGFVIIIDEEIWKTINKCVLNRSCYISRDKLSDNNIIYKYKNGVYELIISFYALKDNITIGFCTYGRPRIKYYKIGEFKTDNKKGLSTAFSVISQITSFDSPIDDLKDFVIELKYRLIAEVKGE